MSIQKFLGAVKTKICFHSLAGQLEKMHSSLGDFSPSTVRNIPP
jgi:hypothetical protein